jgi:hypothetical protein
LVEYGKKAFTIWGKWGIIGKNIGKFVEDNI